jgi:4-amino-4-deoxy-L-arabinose transferase-like glycosyltransferase
MTLLSPAAPKSAPSEIPRAAARRVAAWAERATDDPSLQRRRDRWFTLAVGGVTMLVYLRSLMPGIGYSGDVAKWQYMSVTGGVPHATGEPLWVALIQAWGAVFPFGTPAWRTNLLSAVIGAVAVTVLFRLLRVLDVRRSVAAVTALTFAVSPTFWTQASIAEVYTLHILFLASVTLCLAKWRLGDSNRFLLAGMFLYAMSFGHHLMTVLALPGILWLVWSDRQRAVTLRNAVWVGLFCALGACQYLYLLWMSDVGGYVEVPLHNLADLWDLIRGGEFKDEMWGFSVFEYLEHRVPLLGQIVGAEYLLLQAPIAYGIWRGVRLQGARRDISVHLFSLGLLSTIFATNYDVFDVEVFFLPLLFVLAVFLGLGLDGAIHYFHMHYPGHERIAWGVVGALMAIPLLTGLVDYRRASQRGNDDDAARVERAVDVAGEDALFITPEYQETQYVAYFLLVDGLGDERNLGVVGRHGVTTRQVKRYLRGDGGPVATAARLLDGVEQPSLYTASPTQAEELDDEGVDVTEVAEDVWRIEYPDSD